MKKKRKSQFGNKENYVSTQPTRGYDGTEFYDGYDGIIGYDDARMVEKRCENYESYMPMMQRYGWYKNYGKRYENSFAVSRGVSTGI